MSLPKPVLGLVICYSYLWYEESLKGQEEGRKDRPCMVLFAKQRDDGFEEVTVLPVTHRLPNSANAAVEIPYRTKQRLGLDDDRSFIILTEANRFIWPGVDLKPISKNKPREFVYGHFPYRLSETIRQAFLDNLKTTKISVLSRTS